MKVIINKTPHQINLMTDEGIILYESMGSIRLSQTTTMDKTLVDIHNNDIPITKTIFGEAELPSEIEGFYYIVSGLVCQAYPKRKDFLMVNESIRDNEGKIIGCKSFAINPF